MSTEVCRSVLRRYTTAVYAVNQQREALIRAGRAPLPWSLKIRTHHWLYHCSECGYMYPDQDPDPTYRNGFVMTLLHPVFSVSYSYYVGACCQASFYARCQETCRLYAGLYAVLRQLAACFGLPWDLVYRHLWGAYLAPTCRENILRLAGSAKNESGVSSDNGP
jgi:hypothetical protein